MKYRFLALLYVLSVASSAHSQAFPDVSGIQGQPAGTQGFGGTMSCTGGGLYAQDLDPLGVGSAFTADEELDLTDFEGVVGPDGELTTLPNGTLTLDMRFWILSVEIDPVVGFTAPCSQDDDAGTPYNISFFDDVAGLPGNLLGTSTAQVIANQDTGINFIFGNIRAIDVTLDNALSNDGVTHIGIQRQQGQDAANGNACVALLVNEEVIGTFDDQANQLEGMAFSPTDSDFPLCLDGFFIDPPPMAVPAMGHITPLMLALLLIIGAAVMLRRRSR